MPDPDGEAAVRRAWDRLADAGLSSAGAHPGASNRPHLSLAVRSALGAGSSPAARSDAVAAVRDAAAALPLELALAGIQLFPHGDRTVLALAVTPSAALLELHARLALATAGWGDPLPSTEPGSWMPHVTLAKRLRVDDLPRALAEIGKPPTAIRMTSLRVWDGIRREVIAL